MAYCYFFEILRAAPTRRSIKLTTTVTIPDTVGIIKKTRCLDCCWKHNPWCHSRFNDRHTRYGSTIRLRFYSVINALRGVSTYASAHFRL